MPHFTARWMSGRLLAARASMRSAIPRCGCGKLAMYANTGSSPVAVFAALALPFMATSSFAGVLPWAVFLPLRPATRFVDGWVDRVILSRARSQADEKLLKLVERFRHRARRSGVDRFLRGIQIVHHQQCLAR